MGCFLFVLVLLASSTALDAAFAKGGVVHLFAARTPSAPQLPSPNEFLTVAAMAAIAIARHKSVEAQPTLEGRAVWMYRVVMSDLGQNAKSTLPDRISASTTIATVSWTSAQFSKVPLLESARFCRQLNGSLASPCTHSASAAGVILRRVVANCPQGSI